MSSKILIAYFSREGKNYVGGNIVDLPVGNTEVAAKMIEKLTDGKLFKIDPVRRYSPDYNKCTDEAKDELHKNLRSELTAYPDKLDDYDTIILGYPNWWGTMPMPVWTFLEKFDFSGKTILPLCTHEGSGMGHSENDIQKLCPGAKVEKGLAIRGGSVKNAENDLAAWLKKLNK
ncbi:flavodoxin [Desulfosporosinus sp.]|uniref:flavodoxin n=1 Tax=Desulfosporosinus sp. TaxID=157907 RepID=UPI0023262FF5|nr:flavodoxin [Desulfosporosinus sp.]MCO5385150.1 flavodoxin [Desulfosporosinus sp.]MDA8221408.1 flavodoxin [Desulfitobacterium hafniense]